MFCKHNWEKISEVTLPSAFEQMSATHVVEHIKGFDVFVKTHILVLYCKTCGRLDKTITKS